MNSVTSLPKVQNMEYYINTSKFASYFPADDAGEIHGLVRALFLTRCSREGRRAYNGVYCGTLPLSYFCLIQNKVNLL